MTTSLANPKLRSILKLAACASIALAATACQAQVDSSTLFTHGKFTDTKLHNVTVRLADPTQVTAQLGWHMAWDKSNAWAFIHLTPQIARFHDGQLIATYTEDPDTQKNPVVISGFQFSQDGGAHWGRRYSMLMQHIGVTFIPQPQNSLLALPSELMLDPGGNERNASGPLLKFEDGGKRMVADLDGFHLVDWPWPISVIPGAQPKDNWKTSVFVNGSYVDLGKTLLATVYWGTKGHKGNTLSLISSKDGGHVWHFYSTIAKPEDMPATDQANKRFEGPNESTILRLANGQLMAIFRVGNGMHLRQNFSKDNGLTWSAPVEIPPFSVDPQLVRTANGTIVLATGRPGVHLWVSTDAVPTPQSWQDVDIAERNNEWALDPSYRIGPNGVWGQSSAYTGLVEVAPNRLLLLYDRDPEAIPANSQDLSRLLVMPIEIVRK